MIGTSRNGDPFVGRARELRLLARALDVPDGATASAVCLVGAAGIGKTTLVARSVDERPDVRAVWTRCWNGPGTPALWPWATALADVLGDDPARDLLAPDTRERFAQFDAVAAALRAATAECPLAVVIDDLHWADPASLELLRFLLRDPRPLRLAVVATLRPAEAALAPSTHDVLAAVQREAEVVDLGGLSHDEVAEVAAAVAPGFDPVHLDELVSRTGGNPFFVRELARLMGAGPTVPPATEGIRAIVAEHLALVSDTCRDVLTTAAAQGLQFDVDALRSAVELDGPSFDEALRAAARAGLARALPGDDRRWRFEHALVGEVVLDDAPADVVARAHLATADALERTDAHTPADRVSALARHLAAARPHGAPERLLEAVLAAADLAAARLAWEEESEHLGRAAEVMRELEHPTSELVDVLLRRCVAEKRLSEVGRARAIALAAAELARPLDDPAPLARVALVFPPDYEEVEIDDIHDPEQVRLRLEALARLDHDVATSPRVATSGSGGGSGGADRDRLRARLQATLARSLYWETTGGDRARSHAATAAERERLTTEALATARRLGDAETLAEALNARIYANWGPAARAVRGELAEELIDVAERLGDAHLALSGRVWRVAEMLEQGRLRAADREIDAFEREAQRIRSRLHLWTVARWRANRAVMEGRLREATELAARALDLGATFLDPEVAFHFYTTTMAPIQYLRCELKESYEYVAATAAAAPNVPAWRVGLAAAAAEIGEIDVARRELAVIADDGFALLPRDLNFLGSMMMNALTASVVGDAVVASKVYELLAPYSGRLAIHGTGYSSYGAIDLGLGQCAQACGRPAVARRHYEAAIEQLDPTGSPYAGVARHLLAELIATEEPGRADELLTRAEADLERAGAPRRAARIATARAGARSRLTITISPAGGGWRLDRGDGASLVLPALKGVRVLAELVTHPGTERHVLELAALLEGRAPEVVHTVGADPVIDDEARHRYRARADELRGELDAADAAGDADRSALVADELRALVEQLQEGHGFGGRRRRSATATDRARVNVTKHVRRAIDRIAAADGELGRLLDDRITTGARCCYNPAPGGPSWVFRGAPDVAGHEVHAPSADASS